MHRRGKVTVTVSPGCVVTGDSRAEVEANIREAIRVHLEGLGQDGEPVPEARSTGDYVEVQGPPATGSRR